MLKGSALTLLAIFIAVLAIVGYRYQQYVVEKNYVVDAAAPCDPSQNSCFVADCSPEEEADCDLTPYEKVELPGTDAPDCLLENSCDAFTCDAANGCTITYCSPEAVEDGEACTDVATTSADGPADDGQ